MNEDVAAFQCIKCGEWFTELEIYEKRFRDEPCLNCGGLEFFRREEMIAISCDYCGWMVFRFTKFPKCVLRQYLPNDGQIWGKKKYRLCEPCRDHFNGWFKYVKEWI